MKIFIADDHQIIIDGIRLILENEEDVELVGEASNGQEVLDKLKSRAVDILILDINMPIMDGIETTLKVKKLYPSIKVLILTMYNNAEFIKKLNQAGADGFILKNTGKEEMLVAIKSLKDGRAYFGQAVTKTLLDSQNVTNTAQKIVITKREKEILKLLSDGMTSIDISTKLVISPHTVETHRKNLLSKFQVKNTTSLVKFAFQEGILEL